MSAGVLFAQEINWQGIDFPKSAQATIAQMERTQGPGEWVESGRRYRGKGMFLGTKAEVELLVDGDFIQQAIFTWQEEGDVLASKSYWRTLLRELLGTRLSVDLFSGAHLWRMEGGSHVKWSQEVHQEVRAREASKLEGKIRSESKSRRLYSIDREEHEHEGELTLDGVQLGSDEEITVEIVHHRVEFYQLRPLSSTSTSNEEEQENLTDTRGSEEREDSVDGNE